MECEIIRFRGHRGSILVVVLILAAIGLLFGAGSLLLFRYQCQLRIERQHELEKVYAVRSAMNYARATPAMSIAENGTSLRYFSWSGRNLDLQVKPVAKVFPNSQNEIPQHIDLDIGNQGKRNRIFATDSVNQFNAAYDYEYGMMDETGTVVKVTSEQITTKYDEDNYAYDSPLVFPDGSSTNVKWWVNIGMTNSASWLQSAYGLRYYYAPGHTFSGNLTSDVIRLCIVRHETENMAGFNLGARSSKIGCSHGWPLAKNEIALVLERIVIGQGSSAIVRCLKYTGTDELHLPQKELLPLQISCKPDYAIGMQIAGRRISIFYVETEANNNYLKWDSWEMPTGGSDRTYEYFYTGSVLNSAGLIAEAPRLRVVFEVEASSDKRPQPGSNFSDSITYFRVTPAYQYDINIKRNYEAIGLFKLATVMQVVIDEKHPSEPLYGTMRTYDTHGTSWKGFRKEE